MTKILMLPADEKIIQAVKDKLGSLGWRWNTIGPVGLACQPNGGGIYLSDSTAVGWDLSHDARKRGESPGHAVITIHDVFHNPELVPDLVFCPDGQTAYSVSLDGALIEWQVSDLPLDKLIGWVRSNRYVRELTCDERAQYRVEPLCQAESALP